MTEVKVLVSGYTTQSQAQNCVPGQSQAQNCVPGQSQAQNCVPGADSANNSYASDIKKLKQSRKKVLKLADFIIPGHAGMYKVK